MSRISIRTGSARRTTSRPLAALAFLASLSVAVVAVPAAQAVDDAYRPPADSVYGDGGTDSYSAPPPSGETYKPYRPLDNSRRDSGSGGYGEPYGEAPPGGSAARGGEYYEPVPPANDGGPPDDGASRGYYSQQELLRAGHGFFGTVSGGLASAIEWAFQQAGRPNGYILGQDAGGALVAGLRYGEGTLYTKDAGNHKVFWQGPTVGYDVGAEGSKVMTLVYNLRDPSEIYQRFGGVQGAAYLVGGVGVQLQKSGDVTLAPIRAGVGIRLGANVGYLKYTRNPTWNPF
jgi:hypothetical protein